MPRKKHGRDISGLLLLDKPKGISSNAALQHVKRLYKANKAGHTGSLDPLATGLLPICLGEATKISAFMLDADKRYQASCKLGVTTTTADSEGDIIQQCPVPLLSRKLVEKTLAKFLGEIEQLPPMYSALKYQGQPLYKLARKGKTVERQPRKITIYSIELLSMGVDELKLDIRCSKGTYIRTLAEDIGAILGCGAHISALHRIAVQPFDAAVMLTLDELQTLAEQGLLALDEQLLPLDSALLDWPRLSLNAEMTGYIELGQAVMVANAPTSGLIRLYSREGEYERFFAIGRVLDDGRVGPKRLLFTAK